MQPSILTEALATATAPARPPEAPQGAVVTPMSLGDVPSDQYEALLALVAAANIWQPLQVAKLAWDAADTAGRAAIDASAQAHLQSSADLYVANLRQYDALPELTQQQMLEYDTAQAGASELQVLKAAGSSTEAVFHALNARIEALIGALPAGAATRDWDWRPPAIYPHLAVFHMEFGERHLELRLSVV